MSLRNATIRLAYARPELRAHLLPLLARTAAEGDYDEAMGRTAKGCTWGKGVLRDIHNKRDNYDTDLGAESGKTYEKNCHPKERVKRNLGVDAGENGSAQRKLYNDAYREEVCPEKGNCGAPNKEWLEKQNATPYHSSKKKKK